VRRVSLVPPDRLPVARIAARNLGRNRTRTALAALGIVIGVAAIASLGILGTTLQLSAGNAFGDIGSEVVVTPGEDGDGGGLASVGSLSGRSGGELSPRDVQRVRRVAKPHGEVVPLISDAGTVRGSQGEELAVLVGTNTPRPLFSGVDGRIPQTHTQGALVGKQLADKLGIRVGSTIEVRGSSYPVVALLDYGDRFLRVPSGSTVVLPEQEFNRPYSRIVISAESTAEAETVSAKLKAAFDGRRDSVSIVELSSVFSDIREFLGLLRGVLIGISSISLLVAGVSIVTVMLMSTNERSEELGMLRAVGVTRLTVMRMIVAEALLLGVLGSLAGIALSVVATLGLSLVTPVTADLVFHPRNIGFLALAFCFGVGTSLLSGLYPAWQTANRRPVDALEG